jgi:hypothetical protein
MKEQPVIYEKTIAQRNNGSHRMPMERNKAAARLAASFHSRLLGPNSMPWELPDWDSPAGYTHVNVRDSREFDR